MLSFTYYWKASALRTTQLVDIYLNTVWLVNYSCIPSFIYPRSEGKRISHYWLTIWKQWGNVEVNFLAPRRDGRSVSFLLNILDAIAYSDIWPIPNRKKLRTIKAVDMFLRMYRFLYFWQRNGQGKNIIII